jgi:hypothetical protein
MWCNPIDPLAHPHSRARGPSGVPQRDSDADGRSWSSAAAGPGAGPFVVGGGCASFQRSPVLQYQRCDSSSRSQTRRIP